MHTNFDKELSHYKWNHNIEANSNLPLKWNKEAERLGIRYRVFCASLADMFDNTVPDAQRVDLFRLIEKTPHLDWLLLTKHIGNVDHLLDKAADLMDDVLVWPMPNVWLGITVCNQEEADRDIPKLLVIPAEKRFVSINPMLGKIDLNATPPRAGSHPVNGAKIDDLRGCLPKWQTYPMFAKLRNGIDWVICYGEIGAKARPMHPEWVRSLRDQCADAQVPFMFMQWGDWAHTSNDDAAWKLALEKQMNGTLNERDYIRSNDNYGWYRVGMKAAGRLLDGVEHIEFPE